jgi:transcriptional regulator with XRE-family HTH domain
VAERIRRIRQRRGWTAEALAARCAEVGAPEITRSVIANIETGRPDKGGRRRREVTVDELLILAYALQVPPVLLIVPLDSTEKLQVTANVEMDVLAAAGWVAGDDGVTGIYGTETVPAEGGGRITSVQQRQDTTPLALLRRIGATLRRADVIRQANADHPEAARPALSSIGREINHMGEWLASLGFTPPEVPPDVADVMQRESAAPGVPGHDVRPGEEA